MPPNNRTRASAMRSQSPFPFTANIRPPPKRNLTFPRKIVLIKLRCWYSREQYVLVRRHFICWRPFPTPTLQTDYNAGKSQHVCAPSIGTSSRKLVFLLAQALCIMSNGIRRSSWRAGLSDNKYLEDKGTRQLARRQFFRRPESLTIQYCKYSHFLKKVSLHKIQFSCS
jgi:hypothetical protein